MAFANDEEVFGTIYDNFSLFGETDPITRVSFFGLGASVHDDNLPCNENPQTFRIRFYQDTLYWDNEILNYINIPGRLVCSHTMTLTGVPVYYFGEYTQFQWEAILPTSCDLDNGWISVSGTGNSDCSFFWFGAGEFQGLDNEHFVRTSFPGHYEERDLAFCLSTEVLAAPQADSLVIRPTPGNTGFVTLSWHSPAACTARIYQSLDFSSEFPTNFTLVATESTSAGQHISSPILAQDNYARYVVTLDNS
jgi:hypothetical protein